jgi:hypothetical protein
MVRLQIDEEVIMGTTTRPAARHVGATLASFARPS